MLYVHSADGSHGHTVIAGPTAQEQRLGKIRLFEELGAVGELTSSGYRFIVSQDNVVGTGSRMVGFHIEAVKLLSAAVDDAGLQEIGVVGGVDVSRFV